jgi:hypothetical protein
VRKVEGQGRRETSTTGGLKAKMVRGCGKGGIPAEGQQRERRQDL